MTSAPKCRLNIFTTELHYVLFADTKYIYCITGFLLLTSHFTPLLADTLKANQPLENETSGY